jgi:hypothetical protein
MNEFCYHDVDEDLLYDYIDQAILTCCPYCGDRLEWDLSTSWNNIVDRPVFSGVAVSCGATFSLYFNEKSGCYQINIV